MWVDYRGSLSTVYNDGEISTCGWIIEVHSVQPTMMGRSQHAGRLYKMRCLVSLTVIPGKTLPQPPDSHD